MEALILDNAAVRFWYFGFEESILAWNVAEFGLLTNVDELIIATHISVYIFVFLYFRVIA